MTLFICLFTLSIHPKIPLNPFMISCNLNKGSKAYLLSLVHVSIRGGGNWGLWTSYFSCLLLLVQLVPSLFLLVPTCWCFYSNKILYSFMKVCYFFLFEPPWESLFPSSLFPPPLDFPTSLLPGSQPLSPAPIAPRGEMKWWNFNTPYSWLNIKNLGQFWCTMCNIVPLNVNTTILLMSYFVMFCCKQSCLGHCECSNINLCFSWL